MIYTNISCLLSLPVGMCSNEIIRPPIQGTTLRAHSPYLTSTGDTERSVPVSDSADSLSTSGISFAVSAVHIKK